MTRDRDTLDPEVSMERDARLPDAARFWERVTVRGPDECWEWQASTDKDGYGQLTGRSASGRHTMLKAHRVSWELSRGQIPDGLFVLHKCQNRRCVNPNHLYPGTHLDNMRDVVRVGSQKGERNPAVKLTDEECEQIRSLRISGLLLREIAPMFNVRESQISRICNRRRRK